MSSSDVDTHPPRLLRVDREGAGASDASAESNARSASEALRAALEVLRRSGSDGEEEDVYSSEEMFRSTEAFPWPEEEVVSYERERGLVKASGDSVVVVARVPRVPLSLLSQLRDSLRAAAARRGSEVAVQVPWDAQAATSKPVAFLEARSASEARRAARALHGSSIGGLAGVPLRRGASPRMLASVLADAGWRASHSSEESESDVAFSGRETTSASEGNARPKGAPPPPCDNDELSATLRTLRGDLAAEGLAALERDLDRAVAEGDACRAAKLDVHISRAYRALSSGSRVAVEDDGASTESASEAGRRPRAPDVLSIVEKALSSRLEGLDKAARKRRGRRHEDGELARRRTSRFVVARATLRAERLRSAALARALRLSTSRGVTLAIEARDRRDSLAELAERLDRVGRQLRDVEDRAARAERRAERSERALRRRRRHQHDDDDDDLPPPEVDREKYTGAAPGQIALFRAAKRGSTEDLVVYQWLDGDWVRLAKAAPPRRRDETTSSHRRQSAATEVAATPADPPPDVFVCPITLAVMNDPVVCADGHSYERVAIEKWLATRGSSPLTNVPLDSTALLPNRNLKRAIAKFRSDDLS